MPPARLLPLVIILLGFGACYAQDPPTGALDMLVPDIVSPSPDGAVACESLVPVTISLDKVTSPSCSATQPFRGKAQGADYVVVKGAKGWSTPAKVNLDGSFCIEVQLVADSSNSLTFTPVDRTGCEGQGLVQTIQHSSSCSTGGSAASSSGPTSNVAQGQTVIVSTSPDSGKDAHLVDGKLDTVVRYKAGWAATAADIRIDLALSRPYQVEAIIVRWEDSKGDGCDYASEYDVATSVQPSPGKVGEGGWVAVEAVTSGDGGEDRFDLTAKPTVQHVGLKLRHNGCTSWSETFTLREIEVWATDPAAAAPTVARCGQ